MRRWPYLFQYLIDDHGLLEAGLAMLDGSYWDEDLDNQPEWED